MKNRRQLLLAALLSVAVLLLLAVLFVPWSMGPLGGEDPLNLAGRAAVHPVGMVALGLIVAGFVILGAIGVFLKRCTERPHAPLHRIFSDDGGTAAFEMLLALPFIVIILMVLLQATLMWNATMVIHYAGFAATRSAITIISSRNDDSGEREYLVFNRDDPSSPPSLKTAQIARSAALALLPISGRFPTTTPPRDPEMTGVDVADGIRAGLQMAVQDSEAPWISRIPSQFAYADFFVGGGETSGEGTGIRLRRPQHWLDGDPHTDCPYKHWRRTDPPNWTDWGWQHVPYCPHYTHTLDYAWWEPIELTLIYPFELSVPYADRILYQLGLGEAFEVPGTNRTSYYTMVKVVTKL